ncbi:MAG: ATP-binding protein [Phycisphaerales bacterium]|nr:ATP-binding protein [Phycisphaerales bacterium]
MIRRDIAPRLQAAAATFPAVTLTGPRQSGKSTLCRALFPDHPYANLEAPDLRAFAIEDPRGFLAQYPDGAILDEAQRAPDLPSYLQLRIDDDPTPGRWIITGSQNFALLESISQSLAGRTAVLHLLPMSYVELQRFANAPTTLDEVLLMGGYPRIFDQSIPASDWLASYVATYIERDVRTMSAVSDLSTFQRFVQLCAGRTSQVVNHASIAADAGISQPTAKAWLSLLETSFILTTLPPWSSNTRKRLTRMPRLHFHDTGLVCWLLGIRNPSQLATHPLRGAVFETWVVSEIIKHRTNRGERNGITFYRDQSGLEADALLETGGGYAIFEAKAGRTVSGDMASAARRVADVLGQQAVGMPRVVFGGDTPQQRSDFRAVPWNELHQELDLLNE